MGAARRVILFTVLVMACGEPHPVDTSALTTSCARATGTYVNEATLRSKEGVCPRALDASRDRLEFDDGEYVSPAAVLIPCTTAQAECTLTVTCQVFDLKMVFKGDVVDDATRIVGVATFTGEGDCKSAVYDMDAVRR